MQQLERLPWILIGIFKFTQQVKGISYESDIPDVCGIDYIWSGYQKKVKNNRPESIGTVWIRPQLLIMYAAIRGFVKATIYICSGPVTKDVFFVTSPV